MANAFHNKRETPSREHSEASIKHKGGGNKSLPPASDVGFPSVPGKTQSKSRSGGIKKLKQSMKEEGI